MGCSSSDLKEKECILTLQSIVKEIDDTSVYDGPKHSYPKNCNTELPPAFEGIGILSEIWRSGSEWAKFKLYLTSFHEGEGIDGEPLSMVRYAIFLEMYAILEEGHRNNEEEIKGYGGKYWIW
jgi:hypothetical protein